MSPQSKPETRTCKPTFTTRFTNLIIYVVHRFDFFADFNTPNLVLLLAATKALSDESTQAGDSARHMQGKKVAVNILSVATLQHHLMIPQEVVVIGQETKEIMGRQQSEMEETCRPNLLSL